jgi:hypothetical protein
MSGLSTIGAELHADPDFSHACTVTVPDGAPVATTVRAVNSQAADPANRARRTDRLTCFLYLLVSAFPVRPARQSLVVISDGSPYAGTWRTAEAGEPTGHGEWRCPAVLETTTAIIAGSAGFPRPKQ